MSQYLFRRIVPVTTSLLVFLAKELERTRRFRGLAP